MSGNPSSLAGTPSPNDGPSTRDFVSGVVAFGVLATLVAAALVDARSRGAAREDFDRIAEEAVLRLDGYLRGYEGALHASAGFILGSDDVSPDEWNRFETTLRIPRLLPGASGVVYASRGRADGRASGFTVVDPDDYGVETHKEGVLDFPEARVAIAEACRTGEISSFIWREPAGAIREIVLLRAISQGAARPAPGGSCEDRLKGVVFLGFSPDLLTAALGSGDRSEVGFTMFASDSGALVLPNPGSGATAQRRVIPLQSAGRYWALEAHSLAPFDRHHARRASLIALFAGLIITGLAGALTRSEVDRRRLARNAVSSMQRTLEQTTSELGQTTARTLEVEGRLASLIDSVMDAIISVDRNARILLMNRAAERILRCRADEMIGQSVMRFLPPGMRERFFREVQAFSGGATQRTVGVDHELIARRFDGEEFPIEGAISLAEAGGQRSYTIIARDISERKRTELERRELETQLRQSQKMEAIGTLAGGIAHDFNNILGSILGNAELANEDLPETDGVREFVAEIVRAGERARDLVRRILSFTRQEEHERIPVRLEHVAQEVTAMTRAGLPARIELQLTCAPDAPAVLADAGQIHQVLMNLITNSAQAIGERSGSIQVHLCRVAAAIDPELPVTPSANDYLALSVTDDGPGMTPAVLERIFDPFYTTKPVGQGTGLGLSVVHGIVQQHEGVIRVTSKPGKGTTVRVYLPGLAGEAAMPVESETVVPTGQGQRVLLVDDEEALRSVNDKILRRLGYHPVIADSPAHALEIIESGEPIDLVLTDLGMPGLSGTELAARILKIRPELPIILLTGYGLVSSPEELREQGIRAILPKPVTIRALAETLAAANHAHV